MVWWAKPGSWEGIFNAKVGKSIDEVSMNIVHLSP